MVGLLWHMAAFTTALLLALAALVGGARWVGGALPPAGGVLAYLQAHPNRLYSDFLALDVARGITVRLATGIEARGAPSLSPDGRWLTYADNVGDGELRLLDLRAHAPDGRSAPALTDNADSDTSPVWLPDGSGILFVSFRGFYGIYRYDLASGQETLVHRGFYGYDAPTLSPDGCCLAFYALDVDGVSGVYLLRDPFRGASAPVRLGSGDDMSSLGWTVQGVVYTSTGGVELAAFDPEMQRFVGRLVLADVYPVTFTLSPDGRWLVYTQYASVGARLHLHDLTTGAARPLTDYYSVVAAPLWLSPPP